MNNIGQIRVSENLQVMQKMKNRLKWSFNFYLWYKLLMDVLL